MRKQPNGWASTTAQSIESLLTGKSIPLGPNDSLSAPRDVVPVFHLHGVRTNPEDIIISQEDYVRLFRPNQYRQIKLALTIKEATTLLIGYGLGDVNVLTALDWSRNVFSAEQKNYPNDAVQVLRKETPETAPYRDGNGIIILETADLRDFFGEFVSAKSKLTEQKTKERKTLHRLIEGLNSPNNSMIKRFIDEEPFRKTILKVLPKFSLELTGDFITFLEKCIDETRSRSAPPQAFDGYKDNLVMILDILTAFPLKSFPPALFQAAAHGIERVGRFVGNSRGQSYAAHNVWNSRKGELGADIVKELLNVAEQYSYPELYRLMDSISG